ncbi:MAG TPA: FdtA/QdtA family cupin domain-containing protein [Candidatus Sulfotelmatobacter sp.]|nr:FdtA/QdtA family cupin domain-containing protein [Candidatus Sulfotelmatobacter sp.]
MQQPHRLAVLDDVKLIAFRGLPADDRTVVAFEAERAVPFPIRRVFTVHARRAGLVGGRHAHRVCQQLLVCLHGACEVTCAAELDQRRSFRLERPDQGLWIPATIWGEQRYLTDDTVLMVLCDQLYDADDYLRDPEAYMRFRHAGSALA